MNKLVLVLVLSAFYVATTANYIVFYTLPLVGHVNTVLPLALELKQRGHQVSFTFFDDEQHTIKEYGFPYISLGPHSCINRTTVAEIYTLLSENGEDYAMVREFFTQIAVKPYGPVYTTLDQSIQEKKPDLVVTDFPAFAANDVARKFSIPVVMIVHTMDMLARILPPAPHLPLLSGNHFVEFPSYYEQLENLINPYIRMAKVTPIYFAIEGERAKQGVVYKKSHLLDVQLVMPSVWGYEIPRPVPPNLQLVGHLWPEEPKTGFIQSVTGKWIESSNKPVLFVSLGSLVMLSSSQLTELKEGLMLAVQRLNVRVLWVLRKNQVGREEIVASVTEPSNMRIEAWADQRQILQNKKIFGALLHGGQNSISETVARGKPMIVMPFFGDQPSNAALVNYSGIGIKLNPKGLRREEVVKAIQNIKEHDTYTKGAEKIAQLMKEAGGVKKCADIAERTIKFGVKHVVIPNDNTATWIKGLPYVSLACVLLVVFKVITFSILWIGRKFSPNKPKPKRKAQ